MATRTKTAPKKAQIDEAKGAAAVSSADKLDNTEIYNKAEAIKAATSVGLQAYREVKVAYEVKRAELETLFGKENLLLSIDDLQHRQAEAKAEFDEQTLRFEKTVVERDAELVRKRKLEETAYAETRAAQRQKDERDWKAQLDAMQLQTKLQQDALHRSWDEREKELAGKEKLLADLQKAVSTKDADVQREAARISEVAVATVRREAEQKAALAAKDAEAAAKIAAANLAAANERNAAQSMLILQMQEQNKQLAEANKEIATTAVSSKAIEHGISLSNQQRSVDGQPTSRSSR